MLCYSGYIQSKARRLHTSYTLRCCSSLRDRVRAFVSHQTFVYLLFFTFAHAVTTISLFICIYLSLKLLIYVHEIEDWDRARRLPRIPVYYDIATTAVRASQPTERRSSSPPPPPLLLFPLLLSLPLPYPMPLPRPQLPARSPKSLMSLQIPTIWLATDTSTDTLSPLTAYIKLFS